MNRPIFFTLLTSILVLAMATSPEIPDPATKSATMPAITSATTPATKPSFSQGRFRALLSLIASPSLASPPDNMKFIRQIALTLAAEAPTCSPNVCFAFDGSSSVSAATFAAQVQAAQIITAVLGGLTDVRFAAVQYGSIVQLTSRTTERRRPFQKALGESVAELSPITFVAPGLQFCTTQFSVSSSMMGNEANRIVLMGGAVSTFVADSGPFGAAALAQQFLSQGDNKISGLLVQGDRSAEELLKSVVGGGLFINARDDASLLEGIANVIQDICS